MSERAVVRAVPSAVLGTGEVTPLEMAAAYATLAAKGRRAAPFGVTRITGADGRVLYKARPGADQVVQPGVAAIATDVLRGVVDRGTGTSAQIPGIDVAGKTGTANSTPSRPPYAWFVGFAPANDAKVAVAVLVQSSNTARSEIAGGALCAPIAKAVMQAVIQ